MSTKTVIGRLETEWEWLAGTSAFVRAFDVWKKAEPALSDVDCASSLMAVMADRAESHRRRDQILIALLRQARCQTEEGDLAARTTVQLLLPGVKAIVASSRLCRYEVSERPALVLAAVYEQIRNPRSPWGPARVASQVLGRAADSLRPPRGAAEHTRVVPYGDVDLALLDRGRANDEWADPADPGDQSAGEEVLSLLAQAVRDSQVTWEAAHALAALRVGGELLPEVAARYGVRPNTLAQRMHRLERRLCHLLSDAA